jgi:hypothetical protein
MRTRGVFKFIFFLYNLYYGLFTIFILYFAGGFYNHIISYDSTHLKEGWVNILKPSDLDYVVWIVSSIIESLFLMMLLLVINKGYLKKTKITDNYESLAKRATLIVSLMPILFMALGLYVSITQKNHF